MGGYKTQLATKGEEVAALQAAKQETEERLLMQVSFLDSPSMAASKPGSQPSMHACQP